MQIKLIDNTHALLFQWEGCALDSILLPGTHKNEIVRFGGDVVYKSQRRVERRGLNPMVTLDYRCHVPGGAIGTNYPPALSACLASIGRLSPEAIQAKYGFPHLRAASVLRSRAVDMLTKGFEWTAQRGWPTNAPVKRYRWHQPCCSLVLNTSGPTDVFQCGHPWKVSPDLPYGDPHTNGGWHRAYPDPGKFEGGTVF